MLKRRVSGKLLMVSKDLLHYFFYINILLQKKVGMRKLLKKKRMGKSYFILFMPQEKIPLPFWRI